jgi:hypothetical protein
MGELFFLGDHEDQYSRTNLEGRAMSETHDPKDSGVLSITKPPRLLPSHGNLKLNLPKVILNQTSFVFLAFLII